MIIFCFFVFVVSAGFVLFACFYVFGYALKKKKIFFLYLFTLHDGCKTIHPFAYQKVFLYIIEYSKLNNFDLFLFYFEFCVNTCFLNN